MDNDVIRKMNRALGMGAGLRVDDSQRFEYLRESHRRDAEDEKQAKAEIESGAAPSPESDPDPNRHHSLDDYRRV